MKNNSPTSPSPETQSLVDDVIRRENKKRVASISKAMAAEAVVPEVRERLQKLIDRMST